MRTTAAQKAGMPFAAVQSHSTFFHDDRSLCELVLTRVRLRVRRRLAWMDHLGSGMNEAGASYDINAMLDSRDTASAESKWYAGTEKIQELNMQLEVAESELKGDSGEPLQQLQILFGLSPAEIDLLQACLALSLDPTLGNIFARLQDSTFGYVTDSLAARLFGYGYRPIWNPGSPLAVWGLVRKIENGSATPCPLVVDPPIITWLLGAIDIDEALVGIVQQVAPQFPLKGWQIRPVVELIQRAIGREAQVRVLVTGPSGSGRRTFAAVVTAALGMALLSVDTSEISESDWPDLFIRIQRLAILGRMALIWYGNNIHRPWPKAVAPAPIQFIVSDEGLEICPDINVADFRLELPLPTLEERRVLWLEAVPEAKTWPDKPFEALVSRYRLTVGDIVSAGRQSPQGPKEAAEIARERTRYRLGKLGKLMDCPFTWQDLILPSRQLEALKDFAFEARVRSTFWESPKARRLFPRGTGLIALFSGPPGTGKTMASQVIAAELELDLFRIDLATVVSKYIGETAKNLHQIFARAAHMNAVLLFDEADALFSKRTEVKDSHDRYANADTSYLLQLLEDYQGIAILASNKKANIDPAFTRRVRYVFDFPPPGTAERRAIWRQVITELTDDSTLVQLESIIVRLSNQVEMSGAQIKNAVLAAIFIARRCNSTLARPHLIQGMERELSKDGRALATHQRERLIHHD